MIDCFETFYLRWVKQSMWTVSEAVFLILGLTPENFIFDQNGKLVSKNPSAWEEEFDNTFHAAYDIIQMAKIDIDAGTIENLMAPTRWIEWFFLQGLEIPKEMSKAVDVYYPDFFKKNNNIDPEKKYFKNASNKDSGSCPRCLDKDREIEMLKQEINSSTRSSKDFNKNKMLMVIAGLIQSGYSKQNVKVESVSKQMLNDLASVGCRIEHETLKNYLIDGNDLLNN